jgi:hypothetical protein
MTGRLKTKFSERKITLPQEKDDAKETFYSLKEKAH